MSVNDPEMGNQSVRILIVGLQGLLVKGKKERKRERNSRCYHGRTNIKCEFSKIKKRHSKNKTVLSYLRANAVGMLPSVSLWGR